MPTTIQRAAALAAAFMPAFAAAQALSFDQALGLAVQRSEAARAGRAGVLAANESSAAASQLPDPMLSAGVDNLPVTGADRFSSTREPMTMKRIGVSQEWVPAGKRAAREGAARAMASREAIQVGAAESEARLQAALAYLDGWYAVETLRLATLNEHHVHEEFEAARARLAAATAGSAEVLLLTSARGMAEDESEEARQQQASAFVALQRWIGIRPDALAAAPPSLARPTERDYVDRHPTVRSLQGDVEVARQNAALADSERKSNWTWAVSYGQRTGHSDLVSLGVSIPLQVAPRERQDREIAARLALVDKAEGELAEAVRTAAGEYQSLTSDAERLAQRIDRFQRGVAAPAQQRTAAALAAYRSNQGPLATLFEARHMEVEVQRKLLGLQRDLAKVQAQLALKPLATGAAE